MVSAFTVLRFTSNINIDLSDENTNPSTGNEIMVTFNATPLGAIYQSSPILLPISWGTVAAILLWRGRIRSIWSKQGYDYDTFKLIARMRGSPLRVRLLNSISETPKNKLQLAKEFNVDWNTVNNHIEILLRNSLVKETETIGTTKYYVIAENGRKILSLLEESRAASKRSPN